MIEDWRQSVIQIMELDKITRKIKEQGMEKFEQDWEKVKVYFEKKWDVTEISTLND